MGWFKKTEIILFLNKDDLFRQNIEKDIPLSTCFNSSCCIYKKEYDDDSNYYPKKSTKQKKNRTNNMKADRLEDEVMINQYDEMEDVQSTPYYPQRSRKNEQDEFRNRCAIYPKPELRFSAKNTYDG